MSDAKLRAVVQEIRGQLAGAEGLSPTARLSLEELVRDLETLVDSPPGTAPAASESLRDRLTDAVRRLEASHPVLSSTLGNVVDALAFFGL
jgi:outer membrane protein TolC